MEESESKFILFLLCHTVPQPSSTQLPSPPPTHSPVFTDGIFYSLHYMDRETAEDGDWGGLQAARLL